MEDALGISTLLKDKVVAETTLMLPFPCGTKIARKMIHTYEEEEKLQKTMRWAITTIESNKLMGEIRLVLNKDFNSAEIGFYNGRHQIQTITIYLPSIHSGNFYKYSLDTGFKSIYDYTDYEVYVYWE